MFKFPPVDCEDCSGRSPVCFCIEFGYVMVYFIVLESFSPYAVHVRVFGFSEGEDVGDPGPVQYLHHVYYGGMHPPDVQSTQGEVRTGVLVLVDM